MIPVKFRFALAPFALAIAAVFVSYSNTALALPGDKNETIRGSADNLTVDQKNGVATYTGSVKIQQGSLVISADSIVIHTNPDSSVEKMIATGNPARFQQQPEKDQGVVTAAAKQITYTPSNEHLVLIEDASVEQNGAVMSGPHIDYDLVKEVMKAAGSNGASGSDGQRIEIVIPPKAGKTETSNDQPAAASSAAQSSSTEATP
ncbi:MULTISPECIES: lipopolysaccharide transport periplasmic protein LptA [Cellvibrio]|uniref:Lipopolysaccharide export system protein LptA n=1 Tax=Cellvibrio fibrivorans TaxID=126350 RepID=A0ABU1V305_9GAMM|nr:lipopolysaccharide transport periplasmic protein LptA [Cellvibrio fibrivorans]MDR7091795.1 lipopolysaccharide export system protein LptA [Cellvibrio fibrivorans]